MSRRFAVQVVDDQNLVKNQQPSPPAQPVNFGVSSSSHVTSRQRRFVVETELPQPQEKKPVFTQQAAIPVVVRKPAPVEPPDFLSQREEALKKLWQEQQIKQLPEQAEVVSPKKESNSRPATKAATYFQTTESNSLQKIESFYQKKRPTQPQIKSRQKNKSREFFQKHRYTLAVCLSMAVTIGSMWFSLLAAKAEIKQTTIQAESLLEDLQENRFTSATERLTILEKKQEDYKQIYQVARPVVRLTQGEEKTAHVDRLFQTSTKGLEIIRSSLGLYADLDEGYRQFVGSDSGESIETFTHLSGQFETLFTQLSQLQTEVQQLGNPYKLQVLVDLDKKVTRDLPELRKSVLAAQKLSDVLPELLGQEGSKTYLVLLQNNAELRPTGGFIGSFALLKINNGKLEDFRVEDVYEADGQLDGFVTPPEEIVQYLNEEQWYLRDVNWSPDFPTVAARANWFIDKSMGEKVDGVIAINLDVAKELLKVTGPIEVVDYDEVITPDNLYQLAQTHSEINFFPGSNGKKDFLSAVSSQILNKVFYGETNKLALGEALLKSAEEADLLASFSSTPVEKTFADLGWNGQVRTPTCPSPFPAENCYVDTVMQVEANVGVNKANQFVTRLIEQTSEILEDRVRHTRNITLQNDSASEAWPAGKYKVYLRLLVPENSELRSLNVDGQAVDLALVRTQSESGKKVLGYFVEVPIKSTKKLSFFYETPIPQNMKTYALFEQKQPGTSGDEIVHVFDVGSREVEAVAPEPKIEGRKLEFSSQRNAHEFFGIQF